MKGDSNSSEAKMQLWTELTHTSFVLAASTAWALPLLDLLLRVQVNVLGRCLYCASLEQCVLCGLS
jgi:peroxin-3